MSMIVIVPHAQNFPFAHRNNLLIQVSYLTFLPKLDLNQVKSAYPNNLVLQAKKERG